jgi:tetratricopeptide (TPR) repeat protein
MRYLGCLFIIAVFFAPHSVCAHPETGLLPDAIAETEYKIVLEINPKDIPTRTKLGMVLYRKNKLKEAEQQISEVLKSAPNDFDALDVMGLIRLKEKKPAEAITWLQKAIAINSEDTMVHHSLGLALEQTGRYREAEASYRKGLEVNDRLLRKGVNKEKETERRSMLLSSLQGVQAKLKTSRGGI